MNSLNVDDLRYLRQPVHTLGEQEPILGGTFDWSSVVTTTYSHICSGGSLRLVSLAIRRISSEI